LYFYIILVPATNLYAFSLRQNKFILFTEFDNWPEAAWDKDCKENAKMEMRENKFTAC
jgi:hypothetical protein